MRLIRALIKPRIGSNAVDPFVKVARKTATATDAKSTPQGERSVLSASQRPDPVGDAASGGGRNGGVTIVRSSTYLRYTTVPVMLKTQPRGQLGYDPHFSSFPGRRRQQPPHDPHAKESGHSQALPKDMSLLEVLLAVVAAIVELRLLHQPLHQWQTREEKPVVHETNSLLLLAVPLVVVAAVVVLRLLHQSLHQWQPRGEEVPLVVVAAILVLRLLH